MIHHHRPSDDVLGFKAIVSQFKFQDHTLFDANHCIMMDGAGRWTQLGLCSDPPRERVLVLKNEICNLLLVSEKP